MPTQKIRKTKKTVTTPRDHIRTTPVFKFPPTPTQDYMVVYDSIDGMLFSTPVDFVAVCEWLEVDEKGNEELFEGICFLVLEPCGLGFFDIIYPDNMHSTSNRLGVVRTDLLYWWDEQTQKQRPIYKWDNMRQTHVHLIEGEIPRK